MDDPYMTNGHELNRRDVLRGAGLLGLSAAAGCCTETVARRGAPVPFDKNYSFTAGGRLRLSWSGLAKPLRMWVVGDTHLGLRDERDAAFADHCARMAQWPGEKTAFEKMLAAAKEEKIDLLTLVGDIISFPTLANVEWVKSALDRGGVPWIYVAGNHDWHFEGDAGSDIAQRAHWTRERLAPLYQGENPMMASRVVNGVRIVMIDNSVYHILPEQLDFYRAEAAKGDPLCLCMHIPLWLPGWSGTATCGSPTWGAKTDKFWQIERRERWAERPSPEAFAFREAVLATPNLVGVFAGHIHALQIGRQSGQNLFTTPGNAKGAYLDVTVG